MKHFTLLAIIVLPLVACAADSSDPTLIQTNLPRQLAPDVAGERIAQWSLSPRRMCLISVGIEAVTPAGVRLFDFCPGVFDPRL
jgi:hypothetical protein